MGEQAGASPELCAQLNSQAIAQEKRLQSLESMVGTLRVERELMKEKIEKVEKLAKKKGMFMQTLMDYGLPFVLWWGGLWLGMFFFLFMLLEYDIVSWQDSLRPMMEHVGLSVDWLDPKMGNALIAFFVNEALETLRFAFAVATLKPIVKMATKFRVH